MKILLVEDCEINRAMVSKQLKRRDTDVILAEDGVEGVEKCIAEQPDLVLMDMVMPRLNGVEAAAKLKEHAETKHIPIIALTGFCSLSEQREAMRAGCSAVATKPIDFRLLGEMIDELMARAKA